MFSAYDPTYRSVHMFRTRFLRDLQCRGVGYIPMGHVRTLAMVLFRRVRYVHHYGQVQPVIARLARSRNVPVVSTHYPDHRREGRVAHNVDMFGLML